MNQRLSGFWFAYFLGLGIFFPFYGLYLRRAAGLGESEVGWVLSVVPLVGLVAQPVWGQVADRSGSRRLLLGGLAVGVAAANLVLANASGFGSLVAATALLAVFSTSVVPMATAVTLGAQARFGGSAFGPVRLWGTLGFLVAVVGFPWLLQRLDALAPRGLGWMFPAIAVASLLAAPMAWSLPSTPDLTVRAGAGDWRRLLRHPPVWRLLVVVLVAHALMQGPIHLFPLLIDARGGDVGAISSMWIAMLVLEIPLIGFSGSALRRLGARRLLVLGLVAEGIRWSVTAAVVDPGIVRAAQLLHGVGVAGILIGGPLYLELCAPRHLRATGQAMVATFGFGFGAILSIAGGGLLFERVGEVAPFAMGGGGCLLLALLVHRLLPAPYRPSEGAGEAILGECSTGESF